MHVRVTSKEMAVPYVTDGEWIQLCWQLLNMHEQVKIEEKKNSINLWYTELVWQCMVNCKQHHSLLFLLQILSAFADRDDRHTMWTVCLG